MRLRSGKEIGPVTCRGRRVLRAATSRAVRLEGAIHPVVRSRHPFICNVVRSIAPSTLRNCAARTAYGALARHYRLPRAFIKNNIATVQIAAPDVTEICL